MIFPELTGNLMHFCFSLTMSFKAATCTFWDVALISDIVLFCLMVILFYVKEFTAFLLHSF